MLLAVRAVFSVLYLMALIGSRPKGLRIPRQSGPW
jgi:hypothetical protein